MSPIFSYQCSSCGHEFDEIRAWDPDEVALDCPHCETLTAQKLPSLIGGYQGNTGSASTKPKGSGSKKDKRFLRFKKET